MINYYNKTLKKYKNKSIDKIKREVKSEPKQISWSEHLYKNISLNRKADFDPKKIVKCLYRPYTITNLYYSKSQQLLLAHFSVVAPHSRLFPPTHKTIRSLNFWYSCSHHVIK